MPRPSSVSHGLITGKEDVLERVLISPASEKGNSPSALHIVSGYAEPEMVKKHIEKLKESELDKKLERIELIVGISDRENREEMEERCRVFKQLEDEGLNGIAFKCRYARRVHSKVYVWTNENKAFRAFCGSVNYTEAGFISGEHEEAVCEIKKSALAKNYFDFVAGQAQCSWEQATLINIPEEAENEWRGLMTNNRGLFMKMLINPETEEEVSSNKRAGPFSLQIISGYAEPEMIKRNVSGARKRSASPNKLEQIELIIGMTASERIQGNHLRFNDLTDKDLNGIKVRVRYAPRSRPVHSKIYVWTNSNGEAFRAFCGSINYTNAGFEPTDQAEIACEIISPKGPKAAKEYFNNVEKHAKDSWEEAMRS